LKNNSDKFNSISLSLNSFLVSCYFSLLHFNTLPSIELIIVKIEVGTYFKFNLF